MLKALRDHGADVTLVLERRDGDRSERPFAPDIEVHATPDGTVPDGLLERLRETRVPIAVLADTPEGSRFDFGAYRSVAKIVAVCLNSYDGRRGGADLAFVRGSPRDGASRTSEDAAHLRWGHRYDVVRPDVVRARPSVPWTGSRVGRIVVTLGASDPDRLTEQLLERLDVGDTVIDVVAGPEFGDERSEALRRRAGPGRHVHGGVADLTDLLRSADLVVSLGGQTAYEAMCLGRPVACVRWGPMEHVVDRLAGEGLVVDLGDVVEATTNLARAIRRPTGLAATARAGWLALDGEGAQRAALEVIAAVQRAGPGPSQGHAASGEEEIP
jgi:hypothetical protein